MSPPSTTRGDTSRRDLVKGSALLGAWIAVGRVAYAIGPGRPDFKGKDTIYRSDYPLEDPQNVVLSTCLGCLGSCPVRATREVGAVVKIDGNPFSTRVHWGAKPKDRVEAARARGSICARGQARLQNTHDPFRLVRPLMRDGARGGGRWLSMQADDGLAMLRHGDGSGPGLDAISSLSNVVVAVDPRQLDRVALVRAFGAALPRAQVALGHGAPWIVSASQSVLGADGWIALPRWERARAMLVWGADPFSSGLDPVGDMRALTKREGPYAKKPLVVIDPRLSDTAAKADLWLPVKPGGDVALVWMFLRAWADAGIIHPPEDWIRPVLNQPWSVLERTSGLGQAIATEAAMLLAEAGPGLAIRVGGGVGERHDAASIVPSILDLASMLGALAPGGAMEPTALPPVVGERPADLLRRVLASDQPPIDLLVVVGDGGLSEMAGRGPVFEALRDPARVRTLSVVDSVMNPVSALADFVLPDLTEHERRGLVTRWDGTSLVEPVVSPAAPEATGLQVPFDRGFEGFLELMASSAGVAFDARGTLEAAIAATGSADVLIERGWIPPSPGDTPPVPISWSFGPPTAVIGSPGPLTLVTYRESFGGQVDSTAQYWLTPSLRKHNAAWVHPDTAQEIGLKVGDEVELSAGGSSLTAVAKITQEIRPGVVALALGYGHTAGYDGRTTIDGEAVTADERRTRGVDAALLWSADGAVTAKSAGPPRRRSLLELVMPPTDACAST
jgi:anaerobic selenocysteine-containing dehydrogenase